MRLLLLALCILLSSIAYSGDREASGTVQLYANSGKIIVKLSGSNPTCGNRYFLELDTEYNKALFSMLLSVQMSGKRVWVNGSGGCITGYPYSNAYKLVNMTIYNN